MAWSVISIGSQVPVVSRVLEHVISRAIVTDERIRTASSAKLIEMLQPQQRYSAFLEPHRCWCLMRTGDTKRASRGRPDGQMIHELVTGASLAIILNVKYGSAAGRRRARSPQIPDPATGILCSWPPAPSTAWSSAAIAIPASHTRADPRAVSPAACLAFQELVVPIPNQYCGPCTGELYLSTRFEFSAMRQCKDMRHAHTYRA